MDTSCLAFGIFKQSTKIIEKFIFRGSIFLGSLALLVGCQNSLMTGGTAERGLEGAKGKTTQGLLVNALVQQVSVNQNGPEVVVTLPYKSRGGAIPAVCELESFVLVKETTPCACNDGICSVGIRPQEDVHGEGSFAFHLVDTEKVASRTGNVKVKILPVTISVVSGDRQAGTVKTELSDPLVVLVHNSENVPVRGVKVSWKVLDDEGGSICPETTSTTSDNEGKSKCNWTLGTKVEVDKISADRHVKVSIFDKGHDQGAQPPPTAQFSATVKSGPAKQLVFSTKQYPKSEMVAGSMGPIVIYPQDEYGNLAEVKNLNVTLAFRKKPEGVSVSDITKSMPQAGVAFGDEPLELKKVGTYALDAFSPDQPELGKAVGKEFTVIPAKEKKLVFTQQPGGGIAGAILAQQPKVRAQDTYGNEIPGFASEVTLSQVGDLKDEEFKGKLSVSGIDGVATFTDIKITKAGKYRLEASSPSLQNAQSEYFYVDPAIANKLVFVQEPRNGMAGKSWNQQPWVAIEDFFGNRIGSSPVTPVSVTLIITSSPMGDNPIQLPEGVTTVNMLNGVAKFKGISFNLAGDYILTAISPGLFWATSKPFSIEPDSAAKIAFSKEPESGIAGVPLTPPVVTVQDRFGNPTSSDVNLTLVDPFGGGKLWKLGKDDTGEVIVPADKGIAEFKDLFIKKAGVAYTLKASVPNLNTDLRVSAISKAFDITHGPAKKLVFKISPSPKAMVGKAFYQQPYVVIQDDFGNTVSSGPDSEATLTMSLASGAGALSGEVKAKAVSGVAKWIDLAANFPGEKTLRVTKQDLIKDGGTGVLTGDDSSSFSVGPGDAAKLTFSLQPGGGKAGTVWDQQPQVTIWDDYGNVVTDSSVKVTLAIGTNPGGGTLSGTIKDNAGNPVPAEGKITVKAEGGIANFTGLFIKKSGLKYTLKASSPGLKEDVSKDFDITHGSAAQLVFTTLPDKAKAGKKFDQQPTVTIQDAFGNTVDSVPDSGAILTMSLASGTGTLPGASIMAVLGVAKWTDLAVNSTGKKTLLVTKPNTMEAGGTGVLTKSLDLVVSPGDAAKLTFSVQPGGGKAGIAWDQQPQVIIWDDYGNKVTDPSVKVTLAVANPGGGTLSVKGDAGKSAIEEGNIIEEGGKVTVSANNQGVANFTGLSVDKVGRYTLKASSPGLKEDVSKKDVSEEFDIAHGSAAQLAFTIQPKARAGEKFHQQPTVTIQDAFDNTVDSGPDSEATLTMSLAYGTGVLSGEVRAKAASGVAKWTDLSVNSVGEKVLLVTKPNTTATVGGTGVLTKGSDLVNVGPGEAAKLVFFVEPGGGKAGAAWNQQPKVAILDASNNLVTDSSAKVTLAIETNPGGGTLSELGKANTASGEVTVAATKGIATFQGLSINKVGNYTLKASTTDPKVAMSSKAFDITHGDPAKLAFLKQPQAGIGGAPGKAGELFSQQPVVVVRDAFDNVVTEASVTLAIANQEGGTLLVKDHGSTASEETEEGGKVTLSANDQGVAKFKGLFMKKAGVYTLVASASGVESVPSDPFSITFGEANKLVFIQQPKGGPVGNLLSQQPIVAIQDVYGNTVESSTAPVSLTLAWSSGLQGGASVATQNGVANYSVGGDGLRVSRVGNHVLVAASGSLIWGYSGSFDITHGKATKLVFWSEPSAGATAGKAFRKQPRVVIMDAFYNIVESGPDSTATLVMSLASGTGVLSGEVKAKAASGVAQWTGLSVNLTGEKYLLVTKPNTTGEEGGTDVLTVSSEPVDVSPGLPSKLVFIQQPGNAVAGKVFGQQPIVEVQDDQGNRVTKGLSDMYLHMSVESCKTSDDKYCFLTTGYYERSEKLVGGKVSQGQVTWSGLLIWTYGLVKLKVNSSGGYYGGDSWIPGMTAISEEFENKKNSPPPPPEKVTARARDRVVCLYWSMPSPLFPAPLPPPGFYSYDIYRGEEPNGVSEKLIRLSLKGKEDCDEGLTNGKTYYYRVVANSSNGRGDVSKSPVVPARPLSYPHAYLVMKADSVDSEVVWTPSIGASNYEVLFAEKGYAYSRDSLCKVKAFEGETEASLRCVVKDLKLGKSYSAKVEATNELGGVESGGVDAPLPQQAPTMSLVPGSWWIHANIVGEPSKRREDDPHGLYCGEKPGKYTEKSSSHYTSVGRLINGVTYYCRGWVRYGGAVFYTKEESATPKFSSPTFKSFSATKTEDGRIHLNFEVFGADSYVLDYDGGGAKKEERLYADPSVISLFLQPSRFKTRLWVKVYNYFYNYYGSEERKAEFNFCPLNYIPVPREYASSDGFCVAKYEMKNKNSMATSEAAGLPWVNISGKQAQEKCKELGPGYDLISNDQWQWIAKKITENKRNFHVNNDGKWISLNRGHTNGYEPLAAEDDDKEVCKGGCATPGTGWRESRRTHFAYEDEVIWDLGGNVKELVRGPPPGYGSFYYGSRRPYVYSAELAAAIRDNCVDVSLIDYTEYSADAKSFATLVSEAKKAKGLGAICSGDFFKNFKNSSREPRYLIRGGSWLSEDLGGVLAATLDDGGDNGGKDIGFRCVFTDARFSE